MVPHPLLNQVQHPAAHRNQPMLETCLIPSIILMAMFSKYPQQAAATAVDSLKRARGAHIVLCGKTNKLATSKRNLLTRFLREKDGRTDGEEP